MVHECKHIVHLKSLKSYIKTWTWSGYLSCFQNGRQILHAPTRKLSREEVAEIPNSSSIHGGSDHPLIHELILIEYRETCVSDLIFYIHMNAKKRVGKAHK